MLDEMVRAVIEVESIFSVRDELDHADLVREWAMFDHLDLMELPIDPAALCKWPLLRA